MREYSSVAQLYSLDVEHAIIPGKEARLLVKELLLEAVQVVELNELGDTCDISKGRVFFGV